MTTAHEPRREPGIHLSADDLSAVAEGAQPSAAGAGEHLESCADCRVQVEAISELLTALEQFDAPPVPDDVAIRIDAALAREAAERARSPKPAGRDAQATAAAEASTPRRRRWFASRGLGWALATLVVVGGGSAALVNVLSANGDTKSSANSASAGSANSAAQGPNARNSLDTAGSYGQNLATRAPDLGALSTWVKQTLGSVRPNAAVDSPCFADPRYADSTRITAVNGTFNGQPATLVVYKNGDSTSTVYALVYAAPCAPGSYHVLSQGVVAK